MATDHISQHVGNHGGKYTDMEGMTRQFTYIDHDPKPKISNLNMTEQDFTSIKDELKQYRKDIVDTILSYPAVHCPGLYEDFTLRGEKQTTIEWNESMLRDEGVDLERLRCIKVMIENRLNI